MGYIVDSDDDWSVELRSTSTRITTDYGDTEIDDKDFLNVLKSMLEASIEVAVRNHQKKYLQSLIENFMVRLITDE